LQSAIREGKFRQDFFYRLNAFHITMPPLRGRREDIRGLVAALWSKLKKHGL